MYNLMLKWFDYLNLIHESSGCVLQNRIQRLHCIILPLSLNLRLEVIQHLLLVLPVHIQERGRGVVTWPEGNDVVLHEGQDLGVELSVPGEFYSLWSTESILTSYSKVLIIKKDYLFERKNITILKETITFIISEMAYLLS